MTLPQMLAAHARRHGHRRVALREKEFGIWQEVSWADYAGHVRAVCLGLEALGLQRGETLAIVCGNRPAWLRLFMNTLARRCMVGFLPGSTPYTSVYATW